MPRRTNATQRSAIRGKELEVAAVEMRKAGANYRQIGKALGVGPGTANKAVMRVLKRMESKLGEDIEVVRQIEVERLDDMLRSTATLVREGNLQAIDRWLKIMERRAKLLGLDLAPVQTARLGVQVETASGDRVQMAVEIVDLLEGAGVRLVLPGVPGTGGNGNGSAPIDVEAFDASEGDGDA